MRKLKPISVDGKICAQFSDHIWDRVQGLLVYHIGKQITKDIWDQIVDQTKEQIWRNLNEKA